MLNNYNNTNHISLITAANRIHPLDPLAFINPRTGLEQFDDQQNSLGFYEYFEIDSLLPPDQLQALLDPEETAEELAALQNFENAIPNFDALPNWSTWTPAQAKDYLTANILQGWNTTQANSWIDTNVTNLAGARLAMKQFAADLITIRTVLINIAQAILFIRDLIIKVRR